VAQVLDIYDLLGDEESFEGAVPEPLFPELLDAPTWPAQFARTPTPTLRIVPGGRAASDGPPEVPAHLRRASIRPQLVVIRRPEPEVDLELDAPLEIAPLPESDATVHTAPLPEPGTLPEDDDLGALEDSWFTDAEPVQGDMLAEFPWWALSVPLSVGAGLFASVSWLVLALLS